VPLTELEGRPEHVMSTANLFDLPMCCHYGVGSPAFGVWRELAALQMTTEWVLGGRSPSFPLLYHWRRLAGAASATSLPEELADLDRAVGYWHGSIAIRRRLEAIEQSSESVVLFLEYLPGGLVEWLTEQVASDDADAAIAATEQWLRSDIDLMNQAGLQHFDAHFGNLLTDGEQLYITDFGLAASRSFDLSAAESEFLDVNETHDACHAITRLVDWLVTRFTDVPDWLARDEFIRAVAEGNGLPDMPTAAVDVITRHAPVAVIINEFYRRLHLEDRRTPYPTDQIRQALVTR